MTSGKYSGGHRSHLSPVMTVTGEPDASSQCRAWQRPTAAGIRIPPGVLCRAVHVGVLQTAWPVIAESFPHLPEEEDLFVEVSGPVFAIQFVRHAPDWPLSVIRLNDRGAARVRQMLYRLRGQLPC